MMELTGKDVKNIRRYLKMHAKDLGKKVGLTGSHSAVSVYRWERGILKLSNRNLAGIRKLFFSKRLLSVMEFLGIAMAEIENIPEKIDFIFYPDEAIYQYFNGENAPPFGLYQETNDKIINLIKNLGIAVSLFEVKQEIYLRWLQNRDLQDTQENRLMFVGNYG